VFLAWLWRCRGVGVKINNMLFGQVLFGLWRFGNFFISYPPISYGCLLLFILLAFFLAKLQPVHNKK